MFYSTHQGTRRILKFDGGFKRKVLKKPTFPLTGECRINMITAAQQNRPSAARAQHPNSPHRLSQQATYKGRPKMCFLSQRSTHAGRWAHTCGQTLEAGGSQGQDGSCPRVGRAQGGGARGPEPPPTPARAEPLRARVWGARYCTSRWVLSVCRSPVNQEGAVVCSKRAKLRRPPQICRALVPAWAWGEQTQAPEGPSAPSVVSSPRAV